MGDGDTPFASWAKTALRSNVRSRDSPTQFCTLRRNNWTGVWQLDQFPFREDSVEAAQTAIDFLKKIDRALDLLDVDALREAQARHDAICSRLTRYVGSARELQPHVTRLVALMADQREPFTVRGARRHALFLRSRSADSF